MGLPQSPNPTPHLYPQALQLKLYQVFIFSIPLLFSIILFLLFYLFYLKRRASTLSSPPVLPTRSNQSPTYIHSTCKHIGWKGEIKDELTTILFDKELRARDSQCCVCLGEFEIKEELLQVPSCKHVFHADCIHHWFHSNTTCPLCRCSIIPVKKLYNSASPTVSRSQQDGNTDGNNSNQNRQNIPSEQQQHQLDDGSLNVDNVCREQFIIPIEGSSSTSNTSLSGSGRFSELSNSIENEGSSDRESVVLHIQNPST